MNPELLRINDLRNAGLKWYILGQIVTYRKDKHDLLAKTYSRIFAYLVNKKGAPTECITLKKSAK